MGLWYDCIYLGFTTMPAKHLSNLPDFSYLTDVFSFDGYDLIWNYRPESHFLTENKWELFNRKHCGHVAGVYAKNGYGKVVLDGSSYAIHRIAYAIQSKQNIDQKTIVDHIDGNPRNNHIINLRVATPSQNSMNSKTQPNTVTKIKGIDWNKASNRFRARVCVNGKRYTKYYDNLLDAVACLS